MNICLEYSGWFQCRLATDPDPADEPRGVSGYVHAVAGEPDLDRIIRLQPSGTVPRSHCPPVGVTVTRVFQDGQHLANSSLVGAAVDLLDSPKFEGRNHVLAEDGFEAIVPFYLKVSKGNFLLRRRFDDSMQFPPTDAEDRNKFGILQATGVNVAPGAIGVATGIPSLHTVWQKRIRQLQTDLATETNEITQAALRSRIRSMQDPRNARYFAARMLYSIPLSGTADVNDPDHYLPGPPITSPDAPWPADFWCGAWDPDALCGYMLGYLAVPLQDPEPARGFAAMMSDPYQRRR